MKQVNQAPCYEDVIAAILEHFGTRSVIVVSVEPDECVRADDGVDVTHPPDVDTRIPRGSDSR